MCKPGDRVALIYPNTEPLAFLSAFYGCILAGVVPVPVEVPLTKRVSVLKNQPISLITPVKVEVSLFRTPAFSSLDFF